MTTKTIKASAAGTSFLPAVFAVVLGLGIITLTGHVQASALHDAAMMCATLPASPATKAMYSRIL
eukprot:CAMPEP_0184455930 /NCGR_PEP_ID=MMETSP0740-20130409/25147_1 /TAXON_ID=385413 /ORGANISM="Thalassiosira miniscula, Strain CCMP1093" /LENGTH=64 /DNA_ID=CAMNT_0026827893 /DNA_START=227 /DNA_END=419 /DNA_ORIENTATION=-